MKEYMRNEVLLCTCRVTVKTNQSQSLVLAPQLQE